MLHKWITHIALVLLFAFTQIGTTTHEISHFSQASQQSQPDQHTTPDQCSQCLVYAHAAAGTLVSAFSIALLQATFQLPNTPTQAFSSVVLAHYCARAPPLSLT